MKNIILIATIAMFIIILMLFKIDDIKLQKEVNVSRERENYLLQEVKLLSYQVDVLTNHFMER